MKKSKLLFLVLVFVLALTLVSCGSDKNPPDVTNEPGVTDQPSQPGQPDVTNQPGEAEPPAPPSDKTILANWQEYTITYADGASKTVIDALEGFRATLNEKYGKTIASSTDAGADKKLEILVGNTSRSESEKAKKNLRANDFFIGKVKDRIVIVGGSDDATVDALTFFKSNFMESDGLYYPTKEYTYTYSYVVDKLTVGGVDISEFVIVKGNGLSAADEKTADSLKYAIANICGVELKVVSSSEKEQKHEILIGNTGRALTSKEQKDGTYTVEQSDSKIAIYGKGTLATSAALNKFADSLVNIPKGKSYDIKLENTNGATFALPSLAENNLPKEFADLRDKYDYNIVSAETTLERFFATVEELPDEVTVLDPVEISNYPLAQIKKQVYVSANGDDSNAGTKASPYKTVNRALKDMQNQGGGVIWVESGAYSLEEAIKIDASHSGTALSPLFIKSYGEGGVSLTSNVIVDSTGFKLVDIDNDEVASRLKEGLEDKVYYVNLYDLGWTEDDIVTITKEKGPARMYVDGEEFTLAQFPNAFYEDGVTRREIHDLLYFRYVYDSGSVTARDGSNLYWPWIERVNKDPILNENSILGWEIRVINARDRLADKGDEVMGDEILSWVNTGDIWYYGSVFEGWEHGYYTIDPKCVHSGNLLGTLRRDGFYSLKSVQPCAYGAKVSGNSAAGRNTFILFNAIEALDAPGEWFIDRESGNLYIYPKNDDIVNQVVTYSGSRIFDLVTVDKASYVVLDGIGASSAASSAIYVNESNNVIIQNAKIRNTKENSVRFVGAEKSALIYSDLSYSYNYMVSVSSSSAILNLKPMDVFIQNNVFSDTPSTVSYAVYSGGCRTIVSHNYFIDCCMRGEGAEHIVEYNKFEGGNKFVTDGGMVYFNNYNKRGIHIRYNLFHKINATHNAIYFDTMGSGMYAYCNLISTLNSGGNSHKAWYSSTGHGNVSYANIMVLRNSAQIAAAGGKDTDEGTEAIKQGDSINESGLFYYYYGNNSTKNSLAGHWWVGEKEDEISARLKRSNQEAWNARYPEYMNFLEGTKCILEAYKYPDYKVYYEPQKLSSKTHLFYTATDTVLWIPPYDYLDSKGEVKTKEAQTLTAENGFIVLSFDDIAAMERLRRQPAYSAIKDNIILGGSSDPDNVITNNAKDYKGLLKDVTIKENNYFEFEYNKIMADADNYNYDISDDTWAMLTNEMGAEAVNALRKFDYKKAGLTK